MRNLKIKYANFEIKNLNTKHNANNIINILNNSLDKDLVVFQDLCLTGQNFSHLFFFNDFNQELLLNYDYILSNINYNNLFCFSSISLKNNKLYKVLLVFNQKQLILKIFQNNLNKEDYIFSLYNFYNNQIVYYNDYKLLFTFYNDLKENITLVDNIIVIDNERFIFNNHSHLLNLIDYSKKSNQNIIYHTPSYYDTSANCLYSSTYLFIESGKIIFYNKPFTNLICDFIYEDDVYKKVYELDKYTNYENVLEIVKDPFNQNIKKEGYLLIFNALVKGLEKKILSLKDFNKSIIGISGGLDSLSTLLIAYKAYLNLGLDPKEYIKVYSMPSINSSDDSKKRAYDLIYNLGLVYNEINIDNLNETILKTLNHEKKDVCYENNQSRIRTLLLLNLANIEKGIVLGTGDLSEDALGFNTFGGDGLFMFGINSSITKTQLRQLVDYLKDEKEFLKVKDVIERIKEAKISPELQKGQETEKIVGEYEINDFILYYYLIKKLDKNVIVKNLKELFLLNELDAINYLNNFLKRFYKNQFKLKSMSDSIQIFEYSLNENYFKVSSDNERE